MRDVDARVSQDALDRFLRALHPGSGSLLLHHLTRHDLQCVEDGCPACADAHQHHPSPWMAQELLTTFNGTIGEVALVPNHEIGGIFEVCWNAENNKVAACFSNNTVSVIDVRM